MSIFVEVILSYLLKQWPSWIMVLHYCILHLVGCYKVNGVCFVQIQLVMSLEQLVDFEQNGFVSQGQLLMCLMRFGMGWSSGAFHCHFLSPKKVQVPTQSAHHCTTYNGKKRLLNYLVFCIHCSQNMIFI